MEPWIVASGIALILIGLYTVRHPHRVRPYVRASEWRTDPERARQKQELYARIVGVLLVLGFGCLLVFMGLAL